MTGPFRIHSKPAARTQNLLATTKPKAALNARPRLSCTAAFLLSVAVGPALASPGDSAAPPAGAAIPKPYSLFVGMDLDVQQQKQFHRVHGVVGGSVVISTDGGDVRIPMHDQSLKLRISESLKLAAGAATITGLKGERAYTPAADPTRRWASMGVTNDTSAAVSNYVGTQDAYFRNLAQVNDPSLRPEMRAAIAQMTPTLQGAANSAAANLDRANHEGDSDLYNAGSNALRLQQELDKQLFDAMEVSFAVASPRPLTDPYVVVLAQYRDPNEPPGTAHNWIYAEALGAINGQPRNVHILQGGFPRGFALENFTVHLYDHGREVASNVAAKRLELTRDEAFQYVVADYQATHKGDNVPASPALFQLPADLRTHVSDAQFTRTFYVTVTKDGLPTAAYLDPDCRRKIEDPYLQSVLMDIRFTPQLDKGQPTGGVALVKLSHLL